MSIGEGIGCVGWGFREDGDGYMILIVEDADDKGGIGDDAAGERELVAQQLTGAELDTQLHQISLHCYTFQFCICTAQLDNVQIAH